jgi:hypothetical protein
MANRVEVRRYGDGHPVETRIGMDSGTEMDIASRFPVPGVCPVCGSPLVLKRRHYEPVDGVLEWYAPSSRCSK